MSLAYADNVLHLRKHYANIYQALQKVTVPQGLYVSELSKSGDLTVRTIKDDRPVYLHSRQDPLEEARRWVASRVNENCQHVIFYGFGCGYMVQALLEKKPEIKISIYEPDPRLFKMILELRPLARLLHPKNVDVLGVEVSSRTPEEFIGLVVTRITGETQLLVLPSYQRLFLEKVASFQKKFMEVVEGYKHNLGFNARAETWWTLNSLLNFQKLLETPSIFEKRGEFAKKPLIIVSAGPSLEYEYDHLRSIYAGKMAYIFAVGSAVHGLLAHEITPHAFCSYDPWPVNERVFSSLKRSDYPLIFGTSIFANTLKYHSGPKFYMTINQDTFSPYMLGTSPAEIINDAPTIAICALQLAYRLGCDPIVFVGQDLAFPGEKVYAGGINFARSESLLEKEKEECITVPGVNGAPVLTSRNFDRMRRNMELFLLQFKERTVFNTSPVGARIAGTVEKPLREIMAEIFKVGTVNPFWYEGKSKRPEVRGINERLVSLTASAEDFRTILKNMEVALEEIRENPGQERKVTKSYEKLQEGLQAFARNLFYNITVKPMVRAELDVYQKFVPEIVRENRIRNKANLIVKHCSNLLGAINQRSVTAEFILKGIKPVLESYLVEN